MHYYQFHIGDYRAATAHLTNEEDLAYRRLLDMYYDTEKPIPEDTHWVSRRIRVDAHIIKDVLNDMFLKGEDGLWRHKRVDQEVAKYKAIESRNKVNGSKGGRPRNPEKPSGLPVESHTEPTGKATKNQEPITKNHIKDKQRGSRLAQDFELTEDWVKFCRQERPELIPHKVFSSFKDYWVAQPGQKGIKLDWFATWRNWVRNVKHERPTFAQQAADVARTTVEAVNKGPDPALLKIEADREKASPMPDYIRQQINHVLRK